MLSLLGFGVREFFGIALDYILAVCIGAVGLYLVEWLKIEQANPLFWVLQPLRYVGYALIICACALGFTTWGKSQGAADCIAAARVADLERENATLRRDLSAGMAVTQIVTATNAAIAKQKEQDNAELSGWRSFLTTLPDAARNGRRATADDDRRVCNIVGNQAPGCKPSKLRPAGGSVPGR